MSHKLLIFALSILLVLTLIDLIPVLAPRLDSTHRQLEGIEEQLHLLDDQINVKATKLNEFDTTLIEEGHFNEQHARSKATLNQLQVSHERAKTTLKHLQQEHADQRRIRIWNHMIHPILLAGSLVILIRSKVYE